MQPNDIRTRMNAIGVGLAGIEGAWWLPAAQPFVLPRESHKQFRHIGEAIFALFDAVAELYGTDEGGACGLNTLLSHKVPQHLRRFVSKQHVLAVRPDFQLVKADDGYEFVATELEICPSAQGFAHAMQVGYGLKADLVQTYVRFLNGRELLIVCTQAWSEFVWDQLAFCAALHEAGARARLLFDIPIEVLAEQVRQKQRWVPPMFGISQMPDRWNDDVLSRIQASGIETLNISEAHDVVPSNSVIFRFGYLECFSAEMLQQLNTWEQQGATFLNPTSFLWDSKVVMAAARIPQVRAKLRPRGFRKTHEVLAQTLDRCIPETHLLTDELLPQLQRGRSAWVLKFAGFDSGQQAWGGRSLQVGLQHDDASWLDVLQRYLALPFPVVAQRVTPTERLDITYFDERNNEQWLRNGNTRLRSFFLRDGDEAKVYGAHLTVSGGAMHVSESVDAVQAPVSIQRIFSG